MYDIQGRNYALVSDLKVGDQVQVDDLIEWTTSEEDWYSGFVTNTNYTVFFDEKFNGLFIQSGIEKFFLDAQVETDPSSDVQYYIGIYKD
jgi:hypothetical protein